jgi:hypothetical protein
MYFTDLSLCHYHPGCLDADSWRVPLLTIGWLEHPNQFRRGTAPVGLLDRLHLLVTLTRTTYSHLTFRGQHFCSHCKAVKDLSQPGPISLSEVTIIVPGEKVVYAVPAGIVHYIEHHAYLPPPEFIQAVLGCPPCDSPEYLDALRVANSGQSPPMETAAEFHVKLRRQIEETLRRRKANEHQD